MFADVFASQLAERPVQPNSSRKDLRAIVVPKKALYVKGDHTADECAIAEGNDRERAEGRQQQTPEHLLRHKNSSLVQMQVV